MHGTCPVCGYCGRPIGGNAVWVGSMCYHLECTRGPSWQQTYPSSATPLVPALTVEDVRQIIREELEAAKPKRSGGPK